MRKIFILTMALFGLSVAKAQDFQGMAVYESKTSVPEMNQMRGPGGQQITPEMRKQIEERMKKALEKTFILNFDRTASIYNEEEKLDAPGENGGFRMMANFMGGGGKLYKNTKTKSFAQEKEVFGKEFLISDSLQTIKWDLSSTETKKIGNYNCYKATAVVPANQSDFRNMRPKSEEKIKEEEEAKKAAEAKGETSEKRTDFMGQMEMLKEITITAWYTPEIPVNQGPEVYWGLPGLILEVSDGRTTILCSKVVMNVKEKVEIKAPTKGKKVTQAEFDEIVTKKMEEMREMGGRPGGSPPPRH
jgi:GLPGLI family protein